MATSSTSAKKPPPTVDDLADQLDTLRGDISRLTELATDYGRARAASAGQNAQQSAAKLRERAERDAEHLRARANDLAHNVEDFMHERPATTIGLAVGLGFLVGLLASRR